MLIIYQFKEYVGLMFLFVTDLLVNYQILLLNVNILKLLVGHSVIFLRMWDNMWDYFTI